MLILLKYWPILAALAGVLSAAWEASAKIQQHLDLEKANCQRIEVIERITAAEHPNYSEAIWFKGASTC